jgi:D-amino-acid dehydrogenase
MNRQVETLVVGGGSAGVCSAYFLAKSGKQVTVVDQGQVGAGCSYGNAGVIALHHITPLAAPGVLMQGLKWMLNPESPFYIKPRFNLALLAWLWRFGLACRKAPMLRAMPLMRALTQTSLDLYQELAATHGGFHFKHNGSLMLYKTPASFKASTNDLEHLKQYGIESRVLGPAEVREFEPRISSSVVGGIYFCQDAHLNPSEFVRGLATRAETAGVHFLTSTEVLGFETSNGRVSTVRTTRGYFEPEEVVLTAGSWSPRVASELRLALPIQPAKGYSITVKCPDRDGAMPVFLSETRVIITPMVGILRFAGTLELTGLDFSINQRRVRAIERAVREYLVGMDDFELLEIWRGLRPLTPDGLPIIGRSQQWRNLTIATGHGMQGIALGPVTGKVVAQLICGEAPCVDLSGLREERFR